MKLKTTKSQNELFEIIGSNVNKKYYFFPKIYLKVGDYEFEEKSLKDLPEGVIKYIKNKIENE